MGNVEERLVTSAAGAVAEEHTTSRRNGAQLVAMERQQPLGDMHGRPKPSLANGHVNHIFGKIHDKTYLRRRFLDRTNTWRKRSDGKKSADQADQYRLPQA